MVTVTVEKRYGAATVRAKVSAPTIERAVELAGGPPGARLVLPIEGETFFAAVEKEGIDFGAMTEDQVEAAVDAVLRGAYDARRLIDQMDLVEESIEEAAPQTQPP